MATLGHRRGSTWSRVIDRIGVERADHTTMEGSDMAATQHRDRAGARRRRASAALAAALMGVLVVVLAPVRPASAAAVATVVPYGLTPQSQGDIVPGPDGNLWFAVSNGFGRVTPAGVTTVFPMLDPIPYSSAVNPAVGGDGNIWFTVTGGLGADGAIARVTPSGQATYITAPGQIREPRNLALGADGDMWFTDFEGAVGRITPSGTVTAFATPNVAPTVITAGADGNVWFAVVGGIISRITPAVIAPT
jgi:streptogramin lyase